MLAIIADIHANVHALEAVLADIYQVGAKRIIVNGDLVNRGPNNAAVMERVMNEPRLEAITLGNHDDLMRMWSARDASLPALWSEDPFWYGMAWPARQLEAAGWIGALANLPMTYTVAPPGPDGGTLLLSHGSPRHYREGYGPYLADAAFAEITAAYPADIYIGSHTHRPAERRLGRYLMLNTGAVGTPFNGDPRAQYLLMHPTPEGWRHEFRAVPYDQRSALRAFKTSGYLEEGGLSAHIFYEELRLSRPLYMGFWTWTEEEARPKDWPSWEAFRARYAEKFVPQSISR